MASHLALLGSPCQSHIPYFAMVAPSSRENSLVRLDMRAELGGLIGRRCAAWIKARAQGGRIELVATRNYVFPRTAFYARWLLFRDEATLAEFDRSYPQYRIERRIEQVAIDHRTKARRLEGRVARGDFNLGRIGDERQRENLARRYLEIVESLRALSTELSLLDMARSIAQAWQEELANAEDESAQAGDFNLR